MNKGVKTAPYVAMLKDVTKDSWNRSFIVTCKTFLKGSILGWHPSSIQDLWKYVQFFFFFFFVEQLTNQ